MSRIARLGCALLPFVFGVCTCPAFGQPRAIVVDGSGPWRTAQWTLTASEFTALLKDAGYSVQTVAPVDLAGALGPDVLAAIPSMESLPIAAFQAIAAHATAGGSLMASGGEAFRAPLYLAAGGEWLDSASYTQKVGAPPPPDYFFPPAIPTLSPAREQYTTTAGLRVPVARGRGLFASPFSGGRYRVIGDLLTPAATLYLNTFYFGSLIVWLPSPQLPEPQRTQLVSALSAAANRVSLHSAGATQMVWLPTETVKGNATVINAATSSAQATLDWSIVGPSGVTEQSAVSLSLAPGDIRDVPLEIGNRPIGDYRLTFRLRIGNQEVDRGDSPFRVVDPASSRQPDQKIRVVNGKFVAGGRQVFLRGVNYWPRYIAGIDAGSFNGRSWLEPGQYDPDLVEADLAEIASLGFNLVNIQFSDYQGLWTLEGRSLVDFLDRCRNHGIWVQVSLRTTVLNGAYAGQMSPSLDSYLEAGFLPGHDRVFAYDLLWEPMVGTHSKGGQGIMIDGAIVYDLGRLVLDRDWRVWVDEQYGSLAKAEQTWGFSAPRDSSGLLTNPADEQIENDGAWRVMVAAYRRFLDDYLGRNLGAIARHIRRMDPDALLTYRNWVTMTSVHNGNTGYDIGTAGAHLDFVSPERYMPALAWPENRAYGLVAAYSRYRAGGKPVIWAEFGADIGANGGTPQSRATQASICDAMMRQVADDGSAGASVWWWPGGYAPMDGSDFGIIDPDGAPRECATTLSGYNKTFAAAPPNASPDPPTTIFVDRDADARGAYGLFLNTRDRYVQARQAGLSVVLADPGVGADTATIPLTQVGNAPYAGSGPLKYANAEFGGIRVVCRGLDVVVENGSTVVVPSDAACDVTPTLVNTGEARWLPASAPTGGVVLHTSAGDVPLAASLDSLQRAPMGALRVPIGERPVTLSGRLTIRGVGDFGETLKVMLTGPPRQTRRKGA